MRRNISITLVSLLLLLTPISFSSEKIPDYTPECTQSIQIHLMAAVASLDGSTVVRILTSHREAQTYIFTPAITPPIVWSKTASHGRAPPA